VERLAGAGGDAGLIELFGDLAFGVIFVFAIVCARR
jgi:hypothetical protein